MDIINSPETSPWLEEACNRKRCQFVFVNEELGDRKSRALLFSIWFNLYSVITWHRHWTQLLGPYRRPFLAPVSKLTVPRVERKGIFSLVQVGFRQNPTSEQVRRGKGKTEWSVFLLFHVFGWNLKKKISRRKTNSKVSSRYTHVNVESAYNTEQSLKIRGSYTHRLSRILPRWSAHYSYASNYKYIVLEINVNENASSTSFLSNKTLTGLRKNTYLFPLRPENKNYNIAVIYMRKMWGGLHHF